MAKCEWNLVDCPDKFWQDCPIREVAEPLIEIENCVPFPSKSYDYMNLRQSKLSEKRCPLEVFFQAEISDITPEQLASVGASRIKRSSK